MFAAALRLLDSSFADYLKSVDALNCFFAYRWLLCLFKRELSFADTMRLWEVLWSGYRGHSFELFVALALLFSQRTHIVEQKLEFDGILQVWLVFVLSSVLMSFSMLSDCPEKLIWSRS